MGEGKSNMIAFYRKASSAFGAMLFLFHSLHAEPKIFVVKREEWSHPVEQVFVRNFIQLYKIYYSKDGTCPTFYGEFKYSPADQESHVIDYQKVYAELLKANSNYPYALVDEKNDLKINVGWAEKQQKTMVVDLGKASISTTCKGNSHAHIDDDADYDKFIVSHAMKKSILGSPYKAPMRKADGRKFVAYLYAENPKNYIERDYEEADKYIKTEKMEGQYYIYLYDVAADTFFPGRVKIFNKYYTSIMNEKGAEFFSLPAMDSKKSDILLVSQNVYFNSYKYESYGFSRHHGFLKKYMFLTKKQKDTFKGVIKKQRGSGKFTFYGEYDVPPDQDMYLSVIESLDMLKLIPVSKRDKETTWNGKMSD